MVYDKDQWWTVVKAVMELRIRKTVTNYGVLKTVYVTWSWLANHF